MTFIFLFLSCRNKQTTNPTKASLTKEVDDKMFFNDIIGVEEIKNIKNVPYIHNCNDTIFWSLVNQRKKNIPNLIDKLTDETIIKDVYVPNFGGEYTVADVSLTILDEKIKDIPIFELIGKKFSDDCGYCTYWNFVRKSKKNRIHLQENFKKWYDENEDNLIWVESLNSLTGDCLTPTKGHYEIRQ
jgi:hypothetical protein